MNNLLISLPSLLVKRDTVQLLEYNGDKYEVRVDFNDLFDHLVILEHTDEGDNEFLLQNQFYSLLVINKGDNYEVVKFNELPLYDRIEDDLFYFVDIDAREVGLVRFIKKENKFRTIMKIKLKQITYTLLYAKKQYLLVLVGQAILIYDINTKKYVKMIDSKSDILSIAGKLTQEGKETFISGYGNGMAIWRLNNNLDLEVLVSISNVEAIPHLSISNNIFVVDTRLFSYNRITDTYTSTILPSKDLSFSGHDNILFSKRMIVFPGISESSGKNFRFSSDQKIVDVFSKDVVITQVESTGVFSTPEIRINVYDSKDKVYKIDNTIRARQLLVSFPMKFKQKKKMMLKYFTNVDLSKNLVNVIIKFI